MPYELIIKAEALLEVKEIFEWYEEQKEDLGYEFIDELEVCYQKLSAHPDRFSFINNRYRRIKTNKFPYILVYKIKNQQVVVLRIRHIKQKPL